MSVCKGGLGLAEISLKERFVLWKGQGALSIFRGLPKFFPDWIMQPNFGFGRRVVLRLDRVDLNDLAKFQVKKNAIVDVLLDQNTCLVRRIDVPKAGLSRANDLADVNLRQSLPGMGREMVWRTGQISWQGDKGSIAAHVLKQSVLDKLESHFKECGSRLRSIRVDGDVAANPFIDHRAMINRAGRWWLGMALVGVLAVFGSVISQQYRSVISVEKEIELLIAQKSELSDRAVALKSINVAEQESSGKQKADIQFLVSRSHRGQILARLTQIVPDNIWLSEFALYGSELRLIGFAETNIVGLVSQCLTSALMVPNRVNC